MSDHVYIGARVASLDTGEPPQKTTCVVVYVDHDHVFVAGDETAGKTVEVECPWGSQLMAETLLSKLSAVEYAPYQAFDALLDPAAEIGDAVTVGTTYSVLADAAIKYDAMSAAQISAPFTDEVDDEYPYEPSDRRKIDREMAYTRSSIAKNSESIRLAVEEIGNTNNRVSEIELYVDSITLSVQNGSTSSTIRLTAGDITIASQEIKMDGLVTFTGLSSGTTTIDGACIKTGFIDADRLNLTGSITFGDLSSDVAYEINDAYDMALDASSNAADAQQAVSAWTYSGTTFIDGKKIMSGTVMAGTIQGGVVELLDADEYPVGTLTLTEASSADMAIELQSYGALRFLAGDGDVYMENGYGTYIQLEGDNVFVSPYASLLPRAPTYLGNGNYPWSVVYAETGEIQVSDRSKKNSIEPLDDRYIQMLDAIAPVRFKMNNGMSGRYHAGFIAQDVRAAMAAAGIDSTEFAGYVEDTDKDGNTIYMLRYEEFIPLILQKLNRLEARL